MSEGFQARQNVPNGSFETLDCGAPAATMAQGAEAAGSVVKRKRNMPNGSF